MTLRNDAAAWKVASAKCRYSALLPRNHDELRSATRKCWADRAGAGEPLHKSGISICYAEPGSAGNGPLLIPEGQSGSTMIAMLQSGPEALFS